jgi:diguanylate cyclase (GGDEF)-like protein
MRFQPLRRLSLEALLAWAFGSLIVGALLAAVLAFAVWRLADTAFDEYEKRDAPIALHASKGVDAWLKARGHEERFMLSAGYNVGVAEAKARDILLWKSSLNDVRDYLTQIPRIADEGDQTVLVLVAAIGASLARYEVSFTSAVDSMVRLGNADSGLDGQMRAKARAGEILLAEAKVPALTESLLKLSRIRMDFALTGKEQYVKEFSEEAARFEGVRAAIPQRQVMLKTIKEYGALFDEYVQVVRNLEATKRDSLEAAALLEPSLEQLEHEVLQNTQRRLRALERRITGVTLSSAVTALVALALGSIIAVLAGGRIRVAARRIIGFAARVAAGRLETRLARVDRGEFGALESALNTMADRLQESDEAMNRQARTLEASNSRIALLSEMTGLLQAAVNLDEAASIIARHLSRMQLGKGGALYLYNEPRNHLGAIARWGGAAPIDGFVPEDCWALRRGQTYGSIEGNGALVCAHACHDGEERLYLCLPMVTQGGMLGLIYVVFESEDSAALEEESHFARRLSEQLGLALANLKLRETLREQSLRDPLTKLFNRRFLEESLSREFARAAREKGQIAVLMIDADHFKGFNDAHGHEGGDAALRQLGRVLKENCRASDLACRFGGEEFTVVLPGATREGADVWARRLLEEVRQMKISLHGATLPPLTVSIGVALYPQHGDGADTVLRAADRALYEAKRAGRDQVVIKGE